MRSSIYRGVCLVGATIWATASYAAPLYIGLQEAGVNGGAITDETPSGANPGSLSNTTYGGFFIKSISANGTHAAPNSLPEPDLNTSTLDFTSNTLDPLGGTIKIYISELNQFPVNFTSFQSEFSLLTLNQNVPAPNGAITSITEATYVTQCIPTGGSGCAASYAFQTGTLLKQETLTSAGQDIIDFTSKPVGLTDFYATTLVYTVTATGGEYGEVDADINLSSSGRSGAPPETPLPAAVWMFGSVLAGGVGFGRWRKRRKTT